MISRMYRFHGRGSLNFIYKKGQTVRGEHLSLRFVTSRSTDYRLAVVVSRKVSKSAVVRNRIRRRLYEAMRLLRAQSPGPWPYDIVLTVFHEQVATMSVDAVRETLIKLLKKADIT